MSEVAAVMVPVAALKMWAGNPRRNDPAIDDVAASIKRFGFGAPIIARQENGEVICGHTRLKAAIRLKLASVPVRYLDLTAEEAHAYALADNKLGEIATWDQVPLADAFRELEKAQVDLSGLGWDGGELEKFLGHKPGGWSGGGPRYMDPDEDDLPEPPAVPVSKLGEVYALGPHRLACGDSSNVALVGRVLAGQGLDVVWTDPPYGMHLDVKYDGMHSSPDHRKTGDRFKPVAGDDRPFDPTAWIAAWPAGEHFWWGADYYRSKLPDGGSWVVWDKRSNDAGMDLDAVIGSMFELCWSAKKHKREIARVLWSGHHGMQSEDTKARVHPTQKPVGLARWFFERWAPDGCVVGDPFGGSGVTLIACADTGRVARLIELDPGYCDVIRRRWTRYARANNLDAGPGALDG